jgi:hypothetical protein
VKNQVKTVVYFGLHKMLQKLVLTFATGGGHSVGIVRLRTKRHRVDKMVGHCRVAT